MTVALGKTRCVDWFEEFFGQNPDMEFKVVWSMLNGNDCYGPSLKLPDGRREVYAILGPSTFDDKGIPMVSESESQTLVHEFCHSYTNTFVDRNAKQLASVGDKLFSLARRS